METRDRILAAAVRVMRDKGLARATTKEIARAASLSEGSLYNYFASKEELFLAVLRQRPAKLFALVQALPGRAGTGTVGETLAEVARTALAFYGESIPMGASIFAEPDLLRRHRALLRERGAGPQRANEAVTAYLEAEQRLGRVSRDADPEAAAYLLLGAVYQRAYWRQFLGQSEPPESEAQFVQGVVATLMRALTPLS